MQPKKVAIIGAGPSGLVTAKTLLHNFPHGTFSPMVFESRLEVGGLWPNISAGPKTSTVNGAPGTLDPAMRTNLSRFTVAFSDLSWESVMGNVEVPMFPQARQVGQYLTAYANRYIPKANLRLGCRVTQTVRLTETSSDSRWRVFWAKESSSKSNHKPNSLNEEVAFDDFDYLVMASGYFARTYIPDIPGLVHFRGRVVHSSAIQKSYDFVDEGDALDCGNTAILGGSMSGVEAASAAALHHSSLMFSTNASHDTKCRVHHICSRPFWTLPTYLPQETTDNSVSFLPLDLGMYDLGRRPPGLIEYSLGPVSEDKAAKTNKYFRSLLGAEYEEIGHICSKGENHETSLPPPWVAIGNDYAEFVRSSSIEPTLGRAIAVHTNSQTGLASIEIQTQDGQLMMLHDISTIVLATGFTPFASLSILPANVLSALEYTTEDSFLPVILDKGGTLRSEIPDLGFVGFYRGPYWGVMEMQARFIGEQWAKQHIEQVKTESQRLSLRALRHPDVNMRRGQFPMGDYVGLMEEFARDLNISRKSLSGGNSRSGPVIPARYVYDKSSAFVATHDETGKRRENQRTLESLESVSNHEHHATHAAAALAIFRALQGTWRFIRKTSPAEQEEFGTLTFHPRYPTSHVYDREYVCQEALDSSATGDESLPYQLSSMAFRLSETGTAVANNRIEVWSTKTGNMEADQPMYSLYLTPFYRKKAQDGYLPGEYVIHASCHASDATKDPINHGVEDGHHYQYTFHFNGVAITSWECSNLTENEKASKKQFTSRSRAVYTR